MGRLRSEGGWTRGAGGFVPRSPFLGPKTSPDEHFGEGAAVGKAHPCGLPFAQPFTPLQSGPEWSQARPWEVRCPLGALERCWSSAGMRDLAREHHLPPGALLRGLGVTLGQHSCGAPEAALPVDTIFFFSQSELSLTYPLGFNRTGGGNRSPGRAQPHPRRSEPLPVGASREKFSLTERGGSRGGPPVAPAGRGRGSLPRTVGTPFPSRPPHGAREGVWEQVCGLAEEIGRAHV